MNCVCGMMLHAAALVPLFRLCGEADVRLDCAALARTPCDPPCRRANQRVTAARHWGWVGIICSIRAAYFPEELLSVWPQKQRQRGQLLLCYVIRKITSTHPVMDACGSMPHFTLNGVYCRAGGGGQWCRPGGQTNVRGSPM